MRLYVYSWPINSWVRGACMIVGKRSYVSMEMQRYEDTRRVVWRRFLRFIGAA